jgi:alginate O-acetyltransferase complex protein AlgI
VFFRARTFGRAWAVVSGMAGLNGAGVPQLALVHLIAVAVIVGGIVVVHWRMRDTTVEAVLARVPTGLLVTAWACMAFAIVIEQGVGSAFIYFQF